MVLDQNSLWWLLPIAGIIGTVIGYFLLRRTGKESNDTNQFTSITNALFKRAEQQDADIADMRVQIAELKTQYAIVQKELEDERASTKELKRVNASLVRYVSKLTRLWPQGTTLPEPDEPIS